MNFEDKYDIAPGFEDLFAFDNEEEEIAHDAQMLVYRFLGEVQKVMENRGITRTELARQVNTSPSFITQIFRGDKQPNFTLLARIQRALDIQFAVKLAHECTEVSYEVDQPMANPVVAMRQIARHRSGNDTLPRKLTDYTWLNGGSIHKAIA